MTEPVALPVGEWVLVPKVPTEAMIMAMHDGPLMADDHDLDPDNRKWIASCYGAMVAAAPTAAPSLKRSIDAPTSPAMESIYRAAVALANNIAEFGIVTDSEFLDGIEDAITGLYTGNQPERDEMLLVRRQPTSTVSDDKLAEIRADGWTVAVHNDYALGGVAHTFWLFTHPDGRYVKGEGRTDAAALAAVQTKLQQAARRSPIEGDVGVSEAMVEAAKAAFKASVDAGVEGATKVFDRDNIHTDAIRACLEAALATPRADTRGEVIEECARVADRIGAIFERDDDRRESGAAATIAERIRALTALRETGPASKESGA